jgi:hypothetical protein
MKKTPPYRKIGGIFSAILIALLVYARFALQAELDGWVLGVAICCAIVVLLMAILEIGLLVTDYRKGHLFPLRNTSLYLAIFTVVALPMLAAYKAFFAGGIDFWVFLYPVLMFILPQSVMNVRLNNVLLETKTGVGEPVAIPLFSVRSVKEEADGVTVLTNEEKEVVLLRQYFFAGDFARMRDQLMSLNATSDGPGAEPSLDKNTGDWSAYQGVAGFGVPAKKEEE